jgi:nicotinamidase-related amidase
MGDRGRRRQHEAAGGDPGFVTVVAGENRSVGKALLLVDVIKDFEHEDGERLLASFRERHAGLVEVIARARAAGTPVVYANDSDGSWGPDTAALVRRAVDAKGGELVSKIAPRPEDMLVLKRRYSAFDETPLASLLAEREIAQLAIAGTATEMCVFQTGTDALRLGFEASVHADACATVDEELALAYLERVLNVPVLGRA